MTSLRLSRPLGKPWLGYYGRYGQYERYATLQRRVSNERGFTFTDESRSKSAQARNYSTSFSVPTSEGVIQPGTHVLDFCRKYQISFPSVLRRASGVQLTPNPLGIGVMISEKHCFNKHSLKYLDKYEQPFTKTIFDIYIAQKKQPLWYSVFSVPVTTPLPCKEGARRLRHAFRDALAARGYDRDGRKMDTDGPIVDMHGTVSLICGNPKAACNLKFPELVKHTNKIVAGIENMLARDKYGVFINPIQNQKSNKGQSARTAWKTMDRSSKDKAQNRARAYR
ncbi:uncharacterized protein F4812DRAFT_434834 [Daldinia caldariorum]|uniref:uncharacterized protein n=1 Tax=Daldinia caldariorum TaxID=326644 RepID=UPI002007C22A|nr:uncharacterized protein F4812DRAFT_434834 [Daldinia caldariorum]KAI1466600.1 hypothetical protein F4812DRAFT_434834 [Daldinia caldariorum]